MTFPIPGNDDAIRAITLYCDLIAGSVLDGISAEMAASGADIEREVQAGGRSGRRHRLNLARLAARASAPRSRPIPIEPIPWAPRTTHRPTRTARGSLSLETTDG